ncbi:MAG: hypothetical protein KF767_10065 [Bdellovibrionaceae bacterium]|nr:hypothetical protein [Pseudobdellovibrionaceae bacterium]
MLATSAFMFLVATNFINCKMPADGFTDVDIESSLPTPTPAASPTPIDPAVTAKMQAIVTSQQATSHEAAIPDIRFDWQRGPGPIMQSPAKDDIPSWFPHTKPDWCYILNTWMQVFEADGNTATNTRVQYRNLKLFVLSQSTRTWSQLRNDALPWTDTWTYPFAHVSNMGMRNESSGVSFKPAYPDFGHGYGTHNTIVPQDIRAVFVSMETRLILDDPSGADDRASARYLVNVGADYWPDAASVNTTWSYAPGVGHGRFILATSNWRLATMLVPNGRYGADYQEMIDNPPPLD